MAADQPLAEDYGVYMKAIEHEVKVAHVRAPRAALHVVVEVGDHSGECERVRILDLPVGNFTDVLDPLLRKQLSNIFKRHGIPVIGNPLTGDADVETLTVNLAQKQEISGAKKVSTWRVVEAEKE